MYSLIRPILFTLDPEQAHYLVLKSLQWGYQLKLSPLLFPKIPSKPQTVMGIKFPNPIGLSAGFDRNGEYLHALDSLGFGFIEIGTVVPNPQEGNPKPRIFRLDQQQAIINRMGFASKGLAYVAQQLEKTKYHGILGINIGKNTTTPNERAFEDYERCFQTLWPYAHYFVINISSPNSPGLRDLQQADLLTPLLQQLKQAQTSLTAQHKKYVPFAIKISPDLSEEECDIIASIALQQNIDGIIATNTTLSRKGVETNRYANEPGGLSGKPLLHASTAIIKRLQSMLQNNIPIIASGGIMDEASAQEKLEAGAKLLQIYSGFIYAGPSLIRRLADLFH